MSKLAKKLIAKNKAKREQGENATTLDLGCCGLNDLAKQVPELFELVWLEELILSNNWWNEKKSGWQESLNKGAKNYFYDMPPAFAQFEQLRVLRIGGGYADYWKISDISFLSNLNRLTFLDIRSNQISDSSFLENLDQLTYLDLSYNQISDVNFFKKLTKLTFLDLAHNRISDGHSFEKLLELTQLSLSSNQISDLQFLENLTKLTSLRIEGNQISKVPSLEKLTDLSLLFMGSNQIKDGSFLKELTSLRELDLSNTQIRDWQFLDGMRGLTSIYLGSNKIDDGQFLENLTNLVTLDLRNNEIIDAQFLIKLSNLERIDLVNNQITDLEPLRYLFEDKEMKVVCKDPWKTGTGEINLQGNPLTNPPSEIVEQGNAAILQYFEEREKKQQFQNTEIKLILIGNSTAGKTSLSRYLRERVYEEGQPSTHGIHNYRWQPEGSNLEVNIWDFGGQEYYHATHRLFLSRNSVYTLVWDAQTDVGGYCDTDIHYAHDPLPQRVRLEHFPHRWWLHNIRHFTRGSNPPAPVLLVQNKSARDGIRRVSSDLEAPPYSLLPEWLDNHIDLAALAKAAPGAEQRRWARRFEEFAERLLDKLTTQLTHYEFAVYHRDIRDRVRALASGENPVNEMSWTEFEEMCRDIEPDAKMDLVQVYLRDITGDILYFEQNERLRHRIFLRPDWVCNRIYTILSREVLMQQGLFGLDWVQQALQCDAEEAHDFVELMREFELIFDDSDEQGLPTGQYVAPQYLPEACPKPDKLEAAKEYAGLAHAFTLWFPDFLPKSHIARFVAHWGGQAQQRLFWKNGLLFRTAGCTALVERREDNQLRVEVQAGPSTREEALRQIFQSFLKLEDGEAGFAVSMNGTDFVRWADVAEARHTGAQQLAGVSPAGGKKYLSLASFQTLLESAHKPAPMQQEINKLLGNSKLRAALQLLADHNRSAEVIALQQRLKTLETNERRGVWSFEQISLERNRITEAILALADGEQETSNPAPVGTQITDSKNVVLGSITATNVYIGDFHGGPSTQASKGEAVKDKSGTPPLPILMLTANPAGTTKINLDKEHARIAEKLQDQPNNFALQVRRAVDAAVFKEQTEQVKPRILHFSGHGHGGEYGGIVLQNDDHNGAQLLSASALSGLFEYFAEEELDITLVILNACYSEAQAEAIAQHVPYVIGTTVAIADEAAIAFSIGFYFKLAQSGMDVEKAYRSGRTQAQLAGGQQDHFVLFQNGERVEVSGKKVKPKDAQSDSAGQSRAYQENPPPLTTAALLQWPTEGCLRPTCTRTVLNELLVRRQSVNLTGGAGQGKSRLLHDLKAMAAAQGLRVALLSLKEHRLQYTNFLRAAAMQLGLPRTDYADFADLVSDLSLRRDGEFLLLLDEIEVLNEYASNDPRYNAHFVASLNLLKNLNHLHLLCASREWLKAVVFDGETSLLTLHPIALPALSQQEIQAELHHRLPAHELLQNADHLAQAREAVQAAAQPYALLERLISRVQLGYVARHFAHLLKELGDGKR